MKETRISPETMKWLTAMGQAQEAITGIMKEFDRKRALWVRAVGSDKGFDDWFDEQVGAELIAMMRKAAERMKSVGDVEEVAKGLGL